MLLAKTNLIELFNKENPLKLENGQSLNRVNVAYQTYGKLNSEGTNVVLVCHALTGNAHAAGIIKENENDPCSKPDMLNKYSKLYKDKTGWWDQMIGPDKPIDTNKYCVICPNILGSCYGTIPFINSGYITAHSRACIPPREPPIINSILLMPSLSIKAF